jgi:hypothetical protein
VETVMSENTGRTITSFLLSPPDHPLGPKQLTLELHRLRKTKTQKFLDHSIKL